MKSAVKINKIESIGQYSQFLYSLSDPENMVSRATPKTLGEKNERGRDASVNGHVQLFNLNS